MLHAGDIHVGALVHGVDDEVQEREHGRQVVVVHGDRGELVADLPLGVRHQVVKAYQDLRQAYDVQCRRTVLERQLDCLCRPGRSVKIDEGIDW